MFPLFVLIAALLGGLPVVAVPAEAQETLSPNDIACRLDPDCPKPQPPQRIRPQRGPRGAVVESGPAAEQPLSVNLFVTFAFNSADLTSDARITLDGLGTALRDPRLAGFSFVIAGHTDAKGGDDFNQKLSQRRAEAVRSYLISQFGIAGERLSAKGYGKSQLLDPANPEDGVNRRVQVINAGAIAQGR
jgi:outer membrane protein OmpA-like peptidoglycan-associated protein